MQQQFKGIRTKNSPDFLLVIKSYLEKSLDLINKYNDISILTNDTTQPCLQSSSLKPRNSESSFGWSSSNMITNTSPFGNDRDSQGNSTGLSRHLSYANPYESISRSALYHLRNKVQLNLAYVHLCMGEPTNALNYTTQCLKSSPQGYEKVLASLYHAESCILASRIEEAIQFLNLEVLNMAKNLPQDYTPLINNEASRVVYSEEMQQQFRTGALATVVTYNLSVAYAAKGEFNNAQKILMRCVTATKPTPMEVIICLLYIQLQQGQLEAAKRTILNYLPQYR